MNALARRLALLGTCAALVWTPLALAEIVTTYSVPAPVLTVADLTPDDGVAARMDILSVQTTLTADITSSAGTQSDRSTPAPFTAGAAELSRGASTASARTDGTLNDLALQVTAFPEASYMEAEVTGQQVITFTLTPHARVEIAGHLSLRGGWEGAEPGIANSLGWVFTSLVPADDLYGMSIFRSLRIYGTEPSPTELELDYLLSYSNDSDAIVTMTWTLQSSLESQLNAISPVPEPQAWLMMLGGMLLYGAAAVGGRKRPERRAPSSDFPASPWRLPLGSYMNSAVRRILPAATFDGRTTTAIHFMRAAPLAALLVSGPAWAGLMSESSHSNMRYSIIDLTPDDGIAAHADVTIGPVSLVASLTSDTHDHWEFLPVPPGEPGSVIDAEGASYAFASTSGVAGELFAQSVANYYSGRLGDNGRAAQGADVLLGPHSRIVFHGHVVMRIEWLPEPALEYSGRSEFQTQMSRAGSSGEIAFLRRTLSLDSADPPLAFLEEDYELAFSNDSDEAFKVLFEVSIDNWSYVAEVPEPPPALLLGAGLALCTGWVRRRTAILSGRQLRTH
jgi:hypothetical protein